MRLPVIEPTLPIIISMLTAIALTKIKNRTYVINYLMFYAKVSSYFASLNNKPQRCGKKQNCCADHNVESLTQ